MTDDRVFVATPDPNDMRSDWFGTATAEKRMTGDENFLEGLAGLDHQRWFVIGFDLYFGARESDDAIFLYAIDRDEVRARDYDGLAAYAAEHGALPVSSIKVHGISIRTFMNRMKGLTHVHMRHKSHRDVPLHIVERTDFPPDPELAY
ncbi:hypothetical protein [Mycobacterium paraintracellulare]|uniref:hypothetical protein n=1 Tax=Mycobacterium paraintracellulare TaxID=1138383 RepID=UPI0019273C1C|nr:hypothetical protein [Mycobacterium paraintracellulare]BCP15682.1 hypothetical protein MINTM021_25910 [Mycobacterium paraintracellulare]